MTRHHHMSLNIAGFLRRYTKPKGVPDGVFRADDGSAMTGFDAWHMLKKMQLEGKTGVPGHGCDNFESTTGKCLGHVKSDDLGEQ